MADKSLINSVRDCVRESLYGFSKIYPNVYLDPDYNIVFGCEPCKKQKVAIISGGGAGHEPFPAGFVGTGMLTASVSGSIFASPSSRFILRAIRLTVPEFEEVLLLVPNYTGDVLNFGLAAETAHSERIKVETILFGEDIAQEAYGINSKAGKRATTGIVFIIKIAGFLAQMGKNATEIKTKTEEIMQSMATMGLCTSACNKPGTGMLFELEKNEIELGIGVHGEAGVARLKLLPAKEAIGKLLLHIISYLKLNKGDEVIAMVNNLGSLTYLEQCLLAGELEKQLTQKGIQVLRLYAKRFFTSLNMAGVQICLLKLNENTKKLILEAVDFPTSAPGWQKKIHLSICSQIKIGSSTSQIDDGKVSEATISFETSHVIEKCFIKLSADLIEEEQYLNQLDSSCGDGDCGSTFRIIAEAIQSKIHEKKLNFSNPASLFSQLSLTVQEVAGGTTGALYGLFFQGIADYLKRHNNFNEAVIYGKSWRAGVDAIKKYSTAQIGDKTMLDSLETACDSFQKSIEGNPKSALEAFKAAVDVSEKGCQGTKSMTALAGRASYTDPSKQTEVDAGAHAVTIWLLAILSVLENV